MTINREFLEYTLEMASFHLVIQDGRCDWNIAHQQCVYHEIIPTFFQELKTLQHHIKDHDPPVNGYRDGNHFPILLKMEAETLSRPSSQG